MRQAYIFHVIVPLRGVGCVWLTVMQNKNGGVIVPLRGVGCIMEDLYPSPAMNKVIVPLRGVGCVGPDMRSLAPQRRYRPLAGCGVHRQT